MLLPMPTPYVSSETAMFDMLVSAGEERTLVKLPHQMHLFLVQSLIEHLRDSGITHQTLSLAFLDAPVQSGANGNNQLKRVGDGALILAGFFPERALHLNVSSTYFRSMGEMAYANLSARLFATGMKERGEFFDAVAKNFDLLKNALSASRACPDTEWGAYRRFRVNLY